MSTLNVLTDEQKKTLTTYYEEGKNLVHTAKKLGIVRSSLEARLCYIAKRLFFDTYDELPDQFSPIAPDGWLSFFKTVHYTPGKDGEAVVKQVWDRIKPDKRQIEGFWAFLESKTPICKEIISAPKDFDEDLCLEWKLMDSHLGMHSWAKQTGCDYSIKEAQYLIQSAASHIYANHGNVDTSVIIMGGDNVHADNRSAETEKAGNHLDVDNRYEKSIDAIYESMVVAIEIALKKSNKVHLIVLSGNHDYHSAINLARILKAHYRLNDRLFVDVSPMKHKFFRWGNSYFMYTHGDTGTTNRLATYFLNHIISNDMTGIKRKLIRRGHVHRRGKIVPPGLVEEDGVLIENFPTLAPAEAYVVEGAWTQARATVAEIYHKKWGQRSRMELGVMELMEAYESNS